MRSWAGISGMLGIALLLSGVVFVAEVRAVTPWNLPQTITDENTTVTFAVDSTWHLVEGKTAGLHGKVWLEDPNDPLSIRVEVAMPVGSFDTDWRSRDEKLRKVMHAERYPEVSFVGRTASVSDEGCSPTGLIDGASCRIELAGELRISAVTKSVVLPVVVTRQAGGFQVKGELTLEWAQYGVDDPSILIARLDETVRINVSVDLVQ